MSTNKSLELFNIGLRLNQERKRLGYSQTALATKLNRSKATQVKYESNETYPDAEYFFALNQLGADIYYIITGEQLEAFKKNDERELVSGYRVMDEKEKNILLNLVRVVTQINDADKKNPHKK